MDVTLARKVLDLIFGLILRDGALTDAELSFIELAHVAFGVPIDREARVVPVADTAQVAASLRALPEEVRQEAIELLVDAAAADGSVHEAERSFLETAASAAGWTAEQLEQRIAAALEAVRGS